MPAEHHRPDGGLYQGYYCISCGRGALNMLGTGHDPCPNAPQPKLVEALAVINTNPEHTPIPDVYDWYAEQVRGGGVIKWSPIEGEVTGPPDGHGEGQAGDRPTPPTIHLRIDDANPGHTRLSVFVGRNPGARCHSGQIVLRTDEWEQLLGYINEDGKIQVDRVTRRHYEGDETLYDLEE